MTTQDIDTNLLLECIESLPEFAEHCLMLRRKAGGFVPFVMNRAQRYLQEQAERMLRQKGRVRMIVVKGRQMGCSAWVAARYYHKAMWEEGKQVFILTHLQDATDNLFDVVKRFNEYMPEELCAPTLHDSAKKLVFSDVKSSYAVGTAGSANIGRSYTIHYFHGSEVAFWRNAADIGAGVMQAIPNSDGTEIILESTANGIGNMFHGMVVDSLAGKNEYEVVFTPWFWEEQYREIPPEDWEPTNEEFAYASTHGIDLEQLYFRNRKIAYFNSQGKDGEYKFKQEYPATVLECFETTGDSSYIPAEIVQRARHKTLTHTPRGALVIGVDPAGDGKDAIGVCIRQGRTVLDIYELPKKRQFDNITMQIVGHIVGLIEKHDPERVFVEKTGVGAGVCDRLVELGYSKLLTKVNPSDTRLASDTCKNLRTYMWSQMLLWLQDEPVYLPDNDQLQIELTGFEVSYTSNNQMQLESKDSKRRREANLKSPNLADALALTFAHPVKDIKMRANYSSLMHNKANAISQHPMNW